MNNNLEITSLPRQTGANCVLFYICSPLLISSTITTRSDNHFLFISSGNTSNGVIGRAVKRILKSD